MRITAAFGLIDSWTIYSYQYFLLIFNEVVMLIKESKNNTIIDSSSSKESYNDFVLPIKLSLDPMKYLIVISLKGDSDYEMVEPQLFDDKINGKGIRVLRYRKDKKVDVYWQRGENINPATLSLDQGEWDFNIAGAKITGGSYSLTRNEKIVNFKLDVSKSWKPLDLPVSFRIFTWFNSFFRHWPSTYIWESTVDLENMTIAGIWKRKIK